MRLISGQGDIDGNISMAAKNIRSIAKTTILAGCQNEATDLNGTLTKVARGLENAEESGFGGFDTEQLSAVVISKKSVMTVGNSIGLFASKSLAATKGNKFPVPLKWVDVENIAETIRPYISESLQDMQTEKDVSAGFSRKVLDDIMFGFRKSIQCRTDRSWIMGGKGRFKLFEPAWVQVMKVYETLKNGGVDSKPYEEKPEWSNGRPFPGEEAEESGLYAQLSGLQPQNLTSDGFNKKRKEVKSESDIEEVPLKGGYRVRK
jgi:hypothetical protein